MLILDEFHRIKRENTIVYKTMEKLGRRQPSGTGRQMVSLFMSATPFTSDLKGSLMAPLKFILPKSWESRVHEKHATMSRARFDELLSALNNARRVRGPRPDDSGGGDAIDEDHEGSNKVFADLKDFLAGFMTRRTVESGFLGEMECALPSTECTTIDCDWEPLGIRNGSSGLI